MFTRILTVQVYNDGCTHAGQLGVRNVWAAAAITEENSRYRDRLTTEQLQFAPRRERGTISHIWYVMHDMKQFLCVRIAVSVTYWKYAMSVAIKTTGPDSMHACQCMHGTCVIALGINNR